MMVMEPYFCKRYRKPPYDVRDRSDHERLQDQPKREHQSVHQRISAENRQKWIFEASHSTNKVATFLPSYSTATMGTQINDLKLEQ